MTLNKQRQRSGSHYSYPPITSLLIRFPHRIRSLLGSVAGRDLWASLFRCVCDLKRDPEGISFLISIEKSFNLLFCGMKGRMPRRR
ncbi:hypothetical protein OWV82_002778 [Melia azedarach]|uniref:Uncharacterized protein n=1 Tax=Melia azedarach TaxID=155640 RepID=A0ACC1Z222_MELAZ|nr:hypothetical protein OWV82_002778 [Melia azedarach]